VAWISRRGTGSAQRKPSCARPLRLRSPVAPAAFYIDPRRPPSPPTPRCLGAAASESGDSTLANAGAVASGRGKRSQADAIRLKVRSAATGLVEQIPRFP
jgi:hypothetical protein